MKQNGILNQCGRVLPSNYFSWYSLLPSIGSSPCWLGQRQYCILGLVEERRRQMWSSLVTAAAVICMIKINSFKIIIKVIIFYFQSKDRLKKLVFVFLVVRLSLHRCGARLPLYHISPLRLKICSMCHWDISKICLIIIDCEYLHPIYDHLILGDKGVQGFPCVNCFWPMTLLK